MKPILSLVLAITSAHGQQFSATPLTDFKSGELYLGQFEGGLYEGGINTAPSDHDTAGIAAAASVGPIAGRVPVMISIGESNSTMEWCDGAWPKCAGWSFVGQALRNSSVNPGITVVDGAHAGSTLTEWVCATGPCGTPNPPTPNNQYDRVRDNILTPNGLNESDIQIAVIIETAHRMPSVSLPASNADAYYLESLIGDAIRAAKTRWPNLKMVFLNSRIYAGYAAQTDKLNPEPFAYESGFSCKWVIQAQVNERRNGFIDPVAGEMLSGMPWVGWTAYTWGNGLNNPEGSTALRWHCFGCNPNGDCSVGPFIVPDYDSDNTHPARCGQTKTAGRMLNFFLTSQYSSWFVK